MPNRQYQARGSCCAGDAGRHGRGEYPRRLSWRANAVAKRRLPERGRHPTMMRTRRPFTKRTGWPRERFSDERRDMRGSPLREQGRESASLKAFPASK